MPFSFFQKNVQRPVPKGYPAQVITLGDQIRKTRIDRGLSQPDVAKIIGVSTDTITYWETNRFPPKVMFYPAIIAFLGYFPFDIDTSTFGGKIKRYRFERGLSLKVFAQLAGIDPASVGLWEEGKGRPSRRTKEHIESIVERDKIGEGDYLL